MRVRVTDRLTEMCDELGVDGYVIAESRIGYQRGYLLMVPRGGVYVCYGGLGQTEREAEETLREISAEKGVQR